MAIIASTAIIAGTAIKAIMAGTASMAPGFTGARFKAGIASKPIARFRTDGSRPRGVEGRQDVSGRILAGTCSWNYDSWVGLVYSSTKRRAADYLTEYCAAFRTVEIDSWFYKIPDRDEVESYARAVDDDFMFTCKAPRDLTLVVDRPPGKAPGKTPRKVPRNSSGPNLFESPKDAVGAFLAEDEERNPRFLSPEAFARFWDVVQPLAPRIGAVMLEFEYLNKSKMPSKSVFLKKIDAFVRAIPVGVPLALEPRNGSWLDAEYFGFLRSHGIAHVFSEKIYMPHIYEIYEKHAEMIGDRAVVRLLGGDRAAIEKETGEVWNRIVDPKPGRERIAGMLADMADRGTDVIVNVNNHYEGSSPLSIAELRKLAATRGIFF